MVVRKRSKSGFPDTQRKCDDCGATLKDSVIWFGEDLDGDLMEQGFLH